MEITTIDLYGAIARAELDARADFQGIEEGLRRLECGVGFEDGEFRPYQYAMMALNCHGGILCCPLELMKFKYPGEAEESVLRRLREILSRARAIGERVLRLCGSENVKQFMRRFSFKFHKIFTPGWLEQVGYTRLQLERVLNAASKCARNFLLWLAATLQKLESCIGVDDMRPIEISPRVKKFLQFCDRKSGAIVMTEANGETKMFSISPKAKMAWRTIRMLVESKTSEGEVKLPKNALACFRNTDADNQLKKDDLYEFAQYIHSTGKSGFFSLYPFPKRRYEH